VPEEISFKTKPEIALDRVITLINPVLRGWANGMSLSAMPSMEPRRRTLKS
jgi:hypothetical protein